MVTSYSWQSELALRFPEAYICVPSTVFLSILVIFLERNRCPGTACPSPPGCPWGMKRRKALATAHRLGHVHFLPSSAQDLQVS